MVKQLLNIEIADLAIRINSDNKLALSYLKSHLHSFRSLRNPEWDFNIVNGKAPSFDISSDITDMPLNLILEGNNFKFYVKSQPAFQLGEIDITQKKSNFIHRSHKLSHNFLIPFLRAAFEFFLMDSGGFLVHSCGIVKNGKGYLFPAACGCGKTTISRLCQGFEVLSDELICVRKIKDKYFIYSTPWQGSQKAGYRLQNIYFPYQSDNLVFEKLKPSAALIEIFPNIIYPHCEEKFSNKMLDFVSIMVKRISCYRMHFSLTSRFWERLENDT